MSFLSLRYPHDHQLHTEVKCVCVRRRGKARSYWGLKVLQHPREYLIDADCWVPGAVVGIPLLD